MEKNESDIIAQVLAGRTEAFAYFLDTYGQMVFALIVRMVDSEEDAEELTQDSFMKAFEHLESFYGRSSFSTWIYRIAYNTALSFLRKKRPDVVTGDDRFWNIVTNSQTDETLDDDSDMRIARLQQAIAQLSPDERALLTLFYEEGQSVQEVAEILNLTPNHVKVKLHRLRKKLCALVQEEENR